MGQVPEIVPISDLRQGAAALLKKVRASREPVVISQRGRAAAVLLSIDEYQSREKRLELLTLIANGEKEISEGVGFDLDTVFGEADEILEEVEP